MIEVRRDTYMDETTGVRSQTFAAAQALIAEILDVLIAFWDATFTS